MDSKIICEVSLNGFFFNELMSLNMAGAESSITGTYLLRLKCDE